MTGLALSFILATVAADPGVEIIAHRGESADAPENTLAAFRLAWERKVAAIEFDVHQAKDGTLVVCHDADTKRTTGVKKVIRSSTWDELKDLDAGRWKGKQFAGEKLPTLGQALATVPTGGRCYVEIKVGPEAVPAVSKTIEDSKLAPEQLVIISFQADTVAESKRRMPKIRAYFLSSFKRDMLTRRWKPSVDDLIAQAQRIGADGLDVSYEGPLDADFARRVKEAGLGFYVWTVDDRADAERMVKLGVAAITTNKAAWMKEALGSPTP